MSAEATFWAWKQSVKSSHKLTLLSLANCHNASNGQCNPSIKYISDSTGLNRKTIMSALQYLEELGLIIPQKRYGSGNRYKLKTSTEIGTSTENGTGTKNGTPTSTEIGTAPVPKTGHESKRNLKGNLKDTVHRKITLPESSVEMTERMKEFIDHRINIKKPLTQSAFERFLSNVDKASEHFKIEPSDVIAEVIDAGWQSLKISWLENRLKKPEKKQIHESMRGVI